MTDEHPVGPARGERVLARIQTLLVEADRLEDFLQELVTLAAHSLPIEVYCSVTLAADGRDHPYTAAASHEIVDRFDQQQYAVGEGPCLQTLRTGRPNHVADVDQERRFGAFPDLARDNGLRSMLALPLIPPRQQVSGVMNLYSTEPGGFTRQVREEAAVFAGHASGALGVALKIAGHLQFSLDLQNAIASRTVIDQALGILMAQERCSAERAFEILTRASQQRNVKLRDLAHDLVESVGGRPPRAHPPTPRRGPPLGGRDDGFPPSDEG
ncbi:GAF and ANTAR domain-containing protein [Streptomyces justiciae]|uniref:GAF and ANTAR domain-containing protein n=1 Tax=Streptomyces justiciae TaxID=2780140 RepID=A0ABU3M5Y7_9ACTN|nr:GAF and ANTAR domain-containing protein [Streptomyces justiciae]MDT7846927.1 GAF and ANTAR domain-containing protein [Streptomyces justiciae]